MVSSEVFQDMMAIVVDAYQDKHSHSTTEWQFNHDTRMVGAARDFQLFFNDFITNLDSDDQIDPQQEFELVDE
jgi:hypothetical protein